MMTDAAAIAYMGAFVGLVTGGVALFNAYNSYMKDFNNNAELVFAGRCLDWQGGKLIVPESLCPYLPAGERIIEHDRRVYAAAISPLLKLGEMDHDPRVRIYRTSLDMFLSWLALVGSALDRKLFLVEDIQEVGYWIAKIESEVVIHPFIVAYGYAKGLEKLIRLYREKESDYQDWGFPVNVPAQPPKAAKHQPSI